MEITLKQVEVNKLSLEPGDILVVKIKSDFVDTKDSAQIKRQFETILEGYETQVVVFNMSLTDEVSFDILRENKDNKDISCSDCSCGKKESCEV